MSTNAMWRGEPDRLKKARLEAQVTRNPISAHSIMLSAYISILPSVNKLKAIYYLHLAIWHANRLYSHYSELTHNQLDVLIQFELKFLARFPRLFSRRVSLLAQLAERGVRLAESNPATKAHQCALAYMTKAEVAYLNLDIQAVVIYVHKALAFEDQIRLETDQPQGLRQLVRIFRKAAELYGKKGMYHTEERVRPYLHKALELAKGEAQAEDQVKKIEAVLKKIS